MVQIYFKSAYDHICETVGSKTPETGGILLGKPINNIVQKFVFDKKGVNFSHGYDPNVDFLNKVLQEEWEQNKLEFLGFVHSHPRGVQYLSANQGNGIGDLGYISRIFNAMPSLKRLLVPIIYSHADGHKFKIFPYYANRHDNEPYRTARLKLI